MTREGGRLRAAVVLLLLVSAALFAVGTSIERSHHSTSAQPASESSPPAEGSSESGGDEHASETPSASNEAKEKTSEKLFGFDPEARWVVAIGVTVSVLLGLAVWLRDRASVLIAACLFGLMLAALDIREMVHEIDESRASLVVISLVLAVMHLAIAVVVVMLARGRTAGEAVA